MGALRQEIHVEEREMSEDAQEELADTDKIAREMQHLAEHPEDRVSAAVSVCLTPETH